MSGLPLPPYSKDSGRVPFAFRLSYTARKRVFSLFMEVMRPSREARVLDVGAPADVGFRESNFFEQFYPYKEQIVCVGAENGAHLEQQYPGIRFLQVVPGQPAFICRVGRRCSSPRRWFPVEHHTSVPLLHYLPASLYR